MEGQAITGQKTRRGFNLIESAIVLGVVGLVVGGIWVAASAVMENVKVNETVEGCLFINSQLQEVFPYSNALAIPDGTDLTSFVLATKSYPESWKFGSTLKNPFGGITIITSERDGGGVRFRFRLTDVPVSGCIGLVSRFLQFPNIRVSLNLTAQIQSGVSLNQITTQCSSLDLNVVRLEIPFTRIN